MTHNEYLIELGACEPARLYAATHPTLKSAWDACPIGDWLIWLTSNDAWERRFKGEIEHSEAMALRDTCKNVMHLSCDQIRAALSCPEVPNE